MVQGLSSRLKQIEKTIIAASQFGAATSAKRIVDTVKRSDDQGVVVAAVDRDNLWAMETPQIFKRELLQKAYEAVESSGSLVTDEVSALELIGVATHLVENNTPNIKITFPQDIQLAEKTTFLNFMHMHHDQLRGFHVATSEMPYMDSVSVGIYIPVGSRYEELAVNGVAHFLEHMIFKGTSDRSALDLAIAIEGAGGTINAYTTEDQTCLETRGPVELLPEFLEVMADMLWHSTFSIEEIEREREVIAEEIVMYQENPGDHLHDLLSAALWPDHPLGRPITGTEASIQSIHRETLEEFAEEHYSVEGLDAGRCRQCKA